MTIDTKVVRDWIESYRKVLLKQPTDSYAKGGLKVCISLTEMLDFYEDTFIEGLEQQGEIKNG